MMTTLQRDAIASAQRGDWALADAIELLHPARREHMHREPGGYCCYPLLWGVSIGGRLRAFAYGYDGADDEDEADPDNAEVRAVVDLNGDVLFDHIRDDDPPDVVWQSTHMTTNWALGVVDAHQHSRPSPVQPLLIPETI